MGAKGFKKGYGNFIAMKTSDREHIRQFYFLSSFIDDRKCFLTLLTLYQMTKF